VRLDPIVRGEYEIRRWSLESDELEQMAGTHWELGATRDERDLMAQPSWLLGLITSNW
jgi:hypothetical protein